MRLGADQFRAITVSRRQPDGRPADAGPTSSWTTTRGRDSEHPRTRGADAQAAGVVATVRGPPPHTRGRRRDGRGDRPGHRTTPAHAGPTAAGLRNPVLLGDHPRTRGADPQPGRLRQECEGPPPHTRGRRDPSGSQNAREGTTPAHAGPTGTRSRRAGRSRDHPRTRGADHWKTSSLMNPRGPPPHTRGRRPQHDVPLDQLGTTPAHAGPTCRTTAPRRLRVDHPRTRGADPVLEELLFTLLGPPPHTRGRRAEVPRAGSGRRTTPAHAGPTSHRRRRPGTASDHPRTRGADTSRPVVLSPQGAVFL